MHQSDLQRLVGNDLHLQEEDKAVGRSEQVLSHTTAAAPSPPLTPDR